MTGYGGWSWISWTHVHRFVTRLPGNTNANYRKDLEGVYSIDMAANKTAFFLY